MLRDDVPPDGTTIIPIVALNEGRAIRIEQEQHKWPNTTS